jgi:hypothetical protein
MVIRQQDIKSVPQAVLTNNFYKCFLKNAAIFQPSR